MEKEPQPDISVIIVNWKTIDLLRDVLQSVFANCEGISLQTIVIDNASDDGSADMVEAEFPAAQLIRNSKNMGFAAANNQGFEVARGRYILMLNSDTIVLGDVLAASVAYMDQPSNMPIGAMGCRVLNTDLTMQRTCSMYPSILNLMLLTSGLWRIKKYSFFGRYQMMDWKRDCERGVEVISGCYLMVRREILKEVGTLDERFFFFGEETDWCKRMSKAGWKLRFAPVGEIVHHGSVSARKMNHNRDVLLTKALVRLHFKHNGPHSAAIAWLILLGFNSSRMLIWGLLAIAKRSARARAKHFMLVVMAQFKLLPKA